MVAPLYFNAIIYTLHSHIRESYTDGPLEPIYYLPP